MRNHMPSSPKRLHKVCRLCHRIVCMPHAATSHCLTLALVLSTTIFFPIVDEGTASSFNFTNTIAPFQPPRLQLWLPPPPDIGPSDLPLGFPLYLYTILSFHFSFSTYYFHFLLFFINFPTIIYYLNQGSLGIINTLLVLSSLCDVYIVQPHSTTCLAPKAHI